MPTLPSKITNGQEYIASLKGRYLQVKLFGEMVLEPMIWGLENLSWQLSFHHLLMSA